MCRWLHPALLTTLVVGCGGPAEESLADAGGVDSASRADVTTLDAQDAQDGTAPADAPSLDGTPDSSPPPDASPSHWCDSQEFIFCDDFDEYAVTQGWDGTDEQGATLALDDTAYTSPAHSFLATTNAIGVGGVALGRLQKQVTDAVAQIQLAFDVHPDVFDPSGAGVVIATIELAAASGTSIDTVNLVLRAGSASIDDVGPAEDGGSTFSASYPLTPPPALHAWTHLEIDLALIGPDAGLGEGTITVYANGAATPLVDHAPMSPASQAALPFLFVGAGVAGPSAPVSVRFDNVTLDYQ